MRRFVVMVLAAMVMITAVSTTVVSTAMAQVGPTTTAEVIETGGHVLDATRTGSWVAIVGAVVWFLLSLFRHPALGSITKKIPGRWRLVVACLLGAAGGVLASVAGGVPVVEALTVALVSGPTAVFSNEAVMNTVLGKRDKRRSDK